MVEALGSEVFNGVGQGLVVVRRRYKSGQFLNVGSKGGAKPVFGEVGAGFYDRNKGFFQGVPEIFVKPGSSRMAARANTLKASLIPALIDSATF